MSYLIRWINSQRRKRLPDGEKNQPDPDHISNTFQTQSGGGGGDGIICFHRALERNGSGASRTESPPPREDVSLGNNQFGAARNAATKRNKTAENMFFSLLTSGCWGGRRRKRRKKMEE